MSYWWLKNLYDFNLSQLVRITLFAVRKSFYFVLVLRVPYIILVTSLDATIAIRTSVYWNINIAQKV